MQRERIRSAAARWVVRLSDSPSVEDRAAFEAWRSQSVDHEIAYEREAAAWERLDRLGALHAAPDAANPERLSRKPVRRAWARQVAAIAATALIAVCSAGALIWTSAPSKAYATGVGEHRLIRLQDGSTIELNTNSRVIVRYRHGTRSIELVQGEAMFHVARDARPFAVKTASGRIEAQAADFSVRIGDHDAEVMVTTGAALAGSVALSPQFDAVLTNDTAQVTAMSPDELDRRLAWRQGAIALNGQTLDAAVVEFNRYNERKIVIADRTAGAIRVGGYFKTADVDGFVAAVTRTFPVVVSSRSDSEIRLMEKGRAKKG